MDAFKGMENFVPLKSSPCRAVREELIQVPLSTACSVVLFVGGAPSFLLPPGRHIWHFLFLGWGGWGRFNSFWEKPWVFDCFFFFRCFWAGWVGMLGMLACCVFPFGKGRTHWVFWCCGMVPGCGWSCFPSFGGTGLHWWRGGSCWRLQNVMEHKPAKVGTRFLELLMTQFHNIFHLHCKSYLHFTMCVPIPFYVTSQCWISIQPSFRCSQGSCAIRFRSHWILQILRLRPPRNSKIWEVSSLCPYVRFIFVLFYYANQPNVGKRQHTSNQNMGLLELLQFWSCKSPQAPWVLMTL